MKLLQWESDAFMLIVDYNTYNDLRYQVSYALRNVRAPLSPFVVNGFHRNVRQIWRTAPTSAD